MINHKYYFARLNLIANYEDKKDFLFTGLRTNKSLYYYDYLWGFLNVETIQVDQENYIFGYLAKAKPTKDEEVANFKEQAIDTEEISNSITAKSLFFIHVETGIMAFHPVGNAITRETFKGQFVKLFKEAFDNFFVDAEIDDISENYEFRKVLKRFTRIFKVDIRLHPSNPSFRKPWKKYDERFKELNIDSYRESYSSDAEEKGVRAVEDDEIQNKIVMAEDGYGEVRAKGNLDGESKIVSTLDNPMYEKGPSDNEMPPKTILNRLMAKFKEIFSRFEDNG